MQSLGRRRRFDETAPAAPNRVRSAPLDEDTLRIRSQRAQIVGITAANDPARFGRSDDDGIDRGARASQ
jgi:hypothetical protein